LNSTHELKTAAGKLYGPYDRQELDTQYNNRARVSDYMDYFNKWKEWSAVTREKHVHRLDLGYGQGENMTLDYFPADKPNAAVNVFIHGGYWQSLDKSDFSFVSEGMLGNGVASAVVNYGLCPKVTMDEITRQNRAAVAWLWRNAKDLGIDPRRIYVSGHSAGGHLVGMLLATDWPKFERDLPADLVRSGCAISGLFDLEPIRLCYLNDVLRMDAEMARRNSPITLNYPVRAPLIIAWGGLESDEYHRQAAIMRKRWSEVGYPSTDFMPPDRNHFSLVDGLKDPSSPLTKLQVEAIRRL
jgi:arylformamidase